MGGTNTDGGRGATTELMIAASRGDYAEAARLLPASDLNARDAFGNTALIYAAGAGSVEVLRLLLKAGADASARNSAGASALERARSGGHRAAELLLLGADGGGTRELSLADSDRRLLAAAWDGEEGEVVRLLNAGADPDARTPGTERTPLIAACLRGHGPVALLLLERGADPDARAACGRSALHFVAEMDDAACARTLLAGGADTEARDASGWTPLMSAARDGAAEVALALLDGGADAGARAPSGETAAEIARREGHGELARLLCGRKLITDGDGGS